MPPGESFALAELENARGRSGRRYLEFLRVAAMSGGLYALRRGETDPQSPHTEDEVYVVLRGGARIRVGADDYPVRTGSVIYVPARLDHRFHDITEDLAVLVFFAPPEGSESGQPERRA